jgi:NRAMP (natural resistance-associated macrophage protein)-like metal ion transporter
MNKKELIGKPPAVPHRSWIKKLGPGLITGAADDDPSGIATYSQAGAQFGFNTLWTLFFTFPLMVGIQIISAKIGRVSGHGLATNIRSNYPWPFVYGIVALLMFANTINIAADIAAMGGGVEAVDRRIVSILCSRLWPGFSASAGVHPV